MQLGSRSFSGIAAMLRIGIAFALALFTCNAFATQPQWAADQIVTRCAERCRLTDRDGNAVAVVTVAQIRRILSVNDRLASAGRFAPLIIIVGGDAPNAFASGENVIAMNTGMLSLLGDDEDAMATVLGHEMGHLVRRHGQEAADRNSSIELLSFLVGLALDYKLTKRSGVVSTAGRDVSNVAGSLVSRKFDRDQEREADALGVQWMSEAGFDPLGAIRFWQLMPTSGSSFWSDHPSSSERIQTISSQVATLPSNKRLARAVDVAPPADPRQPSPAVQSFAEFREDTSASDDPVILGLQAFRAKRFDEAFRYAVAAADRRDARGQLGLGYLYLSGLGTLKDYGKARDYLTLAAAQDSAMANTYLGMIYAGGMGVKKDLATAANYYRLGADAGFPFALSRLAELKLLGLGTEKSPHEAIALARRAEAVNDPMADYVMGLAYKNGLGVAQDYPQARMRFEAASRRGIVSADVFLADMYVAGQGGAQDNSGAVRLYRNAADRGSAAGKAGLGYMLLRGAGVGKDYAESRRLFSEAFRAGHSASAAGLGWIYRDGLGVSADRARAMAYFDYSAINGFSMAVRARDELASKLTESDVERAKSLALEVAAEATGR